MTADSPVEAHTSGGADTSLRMSSPRYALALLVVIFVLNSLDRQIVNILAEPIRRELGLHDWQIGLMTGLSFALFYATLGIPIARLAERRNRAHIIAIAVIVWSAFTALCGLAQTFVQLVLARVGVGVGEAGCIPAAHSLITDTVPREKRASALGLYAMGGPLGGLIGMAIGGFLADLWGWRAGFLVVGAPGLLLGALAATTLDEPRRRALGRAAPPSPPAASFKEALVELRACHTFRLFALGSAVQGLIAYGHIAFLGSFFFRAHGVELAHTAAAFGLKAASLLGLLLGVISGLSGMLGAIMGGRLADRNSVSNPRAVATQVAVFNLLVVPVYLVALLVPSMNLSLGVLVLPGLFYGMTYGPLFSVFQTVVQPRTRATAVAIYMLMTNLVGLGVGPLLVGVVSDALATNAGLGAADGLRWALIGASLLGVLAFGLYWRARKYIVGDIVG